MNVTRQQLAGGLADFLQQDVTQVIPETALKIAVHAVATQLRSNPSAFDALLENPAVKMILPVHDGLYDITPLADSLRASINQYGAFTLTLPAIPLVSKGEKTLSFTAADIDRLMERIERHTT